jgi:hypothetical protein
MNLRDIESLNLSVSAINVNSLNVSTIRNKNPKALLKIEGITGKRPDVIFISDIRGADKGEEIKK